MIGDAGVQGKGKSTRHLQKIIWREWRNCGDEEYARHLFELVADEPVGFGASAITTLLGAFYGMAGGLLVGLVATNWEVLNQPDMWRLPWSVSQGFAWRGGVLGSVGALLIWIAMSRRLPWRLWLAWLTPSFPPHSSISFRKIAQPAPKPSWYIREHRRGRQFHYTDPSRRSVSQASDKVNYKFGGAICVLGMALGAALAGPLSTGFLLVLYGILSFPEDQGCNMLLAIAFIGGFGGLWAAGKMSNGKKSDMHPGCAAALGILIVGLLCGLVGWLIHGPPPAGQIENWLFFLMTCGCVGLPAGLLTGLYVRPLYWPVSGLVGGLVLGLITKPVIGWPFVPIAEPAGSLATGLLFLLIGGLGSLLPIIHPDANEHIIEHRSWWYWWYRRPCAAELETALRQISSVQPNKQMMWGGLLRRLKTARRRPDDVNTRVVALEDWQVGQLRDHQTAWRERFIARHALATLGGEAVEPLRSLAKEKDKSLRRTATWLLKCIARDTATRLKKQASCLLCPRCLVRFGHHQVRLSWRHAFTFYGCRACNQSREFLEWPYEVVAVLDAIVAEEQVEKDETLRVNWLRRENLFDFDRVEILHATGKDVERFAMQVANDKDATRRRRYRRMHCTITPGCRLSEHTLSILKNLFGYVKFHA